MNIDDFYAKFLHEKHNKGLISSDTAEKTKLFISLGADVNYRHQYRCTALINARTAEQTKLLLDAGLMSILNVVKEKQL